MLHTTDCSSSEITSKYFQTDIDHDVNSCQVSDVSETTITTKTSVSENSESTLSNKQNILTLEERRLKKKRMLALTPKKKIIDTNSSSLSNYSIQNQINNKVAPTITIIDSNNEENTTQNVSEQIDVNKIMSSTKSFDFQLMMSDSFSSDNSFSSDYSYESNSLQSIKQTSVNKDNFSPFSKKPSTKSNSNRNARDDLSQPCLCVICGKDLTGFNIITRETHLNRCLDDIEKQENEKQQGIKTNQQKQVKKTISPSNDRMFIDNDFSWFTLITNCPCCLKNFPGKSKTAKSKITHIKRCAIVSQSYAVSALEGIDQDDDFKSNVIITSISTIETIGKRKFREDTDDDFRVAKVLSKSMMPQYINSKKKIVYDLNTTPILAPAESIKKAQKRAKKMFFDRPTIHDIVKDYPFTSSSSFCTSGIVKQRECHQFMKLDDENGISISRKKTTSLWEIQAIGGPDSTLSGDDYMTDMLKEWVFKYESHKLDQYYLQPFRKRYEMCDRCVNKYWGRLEPENEERDEMIERSYYFCR
ncbi:4848_t:CDS:2 [Cetraspora pellucida]|uniref:4848_t:CDS:1 n=1 Tax=Cetraspora pellucida TaxID=1433469 RepID=A0A9N8VUI7_9GLOM|nr:4848_t:CDS:2 [Cetraspora pellucida]